MLQLVGAAPTTSELSTILLPTKVRLILEVLRYAPAHTSVHDGFGCTRCWKLDPCFGAVQSVVLHKIFGGVFFNTLRPRQNGRHFPDDILKCIFLNESVRLSIKISLNIVP